jgi:myo-inositol-1(or 4)-monophosphatase
VSEDPRRLVLDTLSLARRVLRVSGPSARAEVHDSHVTDISTQGDRAVSRALIQYFRDSGLPATLQSEESGRLDLTPNPKYLIAFDDLDGTDNFFRGGGLLPYCTVVAILQGAHPRFSDTLAAGVIEHRSGTIWLAEKGRGTTRDGAPTRASRRVHLDRRTLVTLDHYAAGAAVSRLATLHQDAWVKDFGSAALHLAGVSSGLFDAYVSPKQKGHEIAAGYLLIRESGGWLSDFAGTPLDDNVFDFDSTCRIVACASRPLFVEIQSRLNLP